jgi:hypothetical protein
MLFNRYIILLMTSFYLKRGQFLRGFWFGLVWFGYYLMSLGGSHGIMIHGLSKYNWTCYLNRNLTRS